MERCTQGKQVLHYNRISCGSLDLNSIREYQIKLIYVKYKKKKNVEENIRGSKIKNPLSFFHSRKSSNVDHFTILQNKHEDDPDVVKEQIYLN